MSLENKFHIYRLDRWAVEFGLLSKSLCMSRYFFIFAPPSYTPKALSYQRLSLQESHLMHKVAVLVLGVRLRYCLSSLDEGIFAQTA